MRSKKAISKKKATHRKTGTARKRLAPTNWHPLEFEAVEPSGLGPDSGGQSGDIEGLSNVATGNSESVTELIEEGQDLEAEKVSGVENARDPDEAEVRTHGARK